MARKSAPDTIVCRNRKATHRYQVLDTIECGIALYGSEVKALRSKLASLDEAYARIERDELWLIGFHIGAYSHAHTTGHELARRRKLLVHTREINKLRPKVDQKGLTLVPMRIYFNDRGWAKVSIALVRGKSQADKRQASKTRDQQREIDRFMRRR